MMQYIIAKNAYHSMPNNLLEKVKKPILQNILYKRKFIKPLSTQDYSIVPFCESKCIFIHIPKCAGISISTSLFGCYGGGHMELWKYQFLLDNNFYNSAFKFTYVRNPWDRVFSAFNFLKNGGFDERDQSWSLKILKNNLSFEKFVKDLLHRTTIQKKNHFKPQVDFMKDLSGNIGLDYIGRFESIENDYLVITERLNMNKKLTKENVGRKKGIDYRLQYDNEMVDIVRRVYKNDIEILSYEF